METNVMETNVAYAICSMNDIPSQKARGFQLMRLEDDGTKRPWSILSLCDGGGRSSDTE